eukprot:scaffold118126_cov56-Attheya_sp.AAC.8
MEEFHYRKGRHLGKGGFGDVYECTALEGCTVLETNKVYAMKIIEKARLGEKGMAFVSEEIKINRSILHNHICRQKHTFQDSSNIYMILELCEKQSLSEVVRRRTRLTELEVMYYMKQLVEAVKYLHDNRVILYRMLVGHAPFGSRSNADATILRIQSNAYGIPTNVPLSRRAKHLITWILQPNPLNRPSLDQILDHPFFTNPNLKVPKALPTTASHQMPHFEIDGKGDLVPINDPERQRVVSDVLMESNGAAIPSSRPMSRARDSNTRLERQNRVQRFPPGWNPRLSNHAPVTENVKVTSNVSQKNVAPFQFKPRKEVITERPPRLMFKFSNGSKVRKEGNRKPTPYPKNWNGLSAGKKLASLR